MTSSIINFLLLLASFNLGNCTPFKRQADFWNTNNELSNSWQGGIPSNPPSSNSFWTDDRPVWGPVQPVRPNGRPNPPRPPRPTNPPRQTTTAAPDDEATPQGGLTLHVAPENCPCFKTGQFNPVCGTDTNTYSNMGLLQCYQNCGTTVEMRYMGACRRSG